MSKGVGQWFERHIQYADFEAQEMLNQRTTLWDFKQLLLGGDSQRRRALKKIFQALPGRPLIKFVTLYVLRRGFLDGRAGFRYAVMQAIYEYVISLRLAELRRGGIPSHQSVVQGDDTTFGAVLERSGG
jgi:hypothetical protein